MSPETGRSCEACHQPVSASRVRRFGEGVVMLGRILWILGLVLLVGGPAFGCAMLRIGAPALSEDVSGAKQEAVSALRAIDGLPPELIGRFESTSLISGDERDRLDPDQRAQVDAVFRDFLAAGAGAALRGTAAVGFIGLGLVSAFLFGTVAVVVGLVLASRKTVWTCDVCHHVQPASKPR